MKALLLCIIVTAVAGNPYRKSGLGNDTQWISTNLSSVRIAGGDNANPGEIPYEVSLQFKNRKRKHFCGGSIILESWIVTAAHCVNNVHYSEIEVVAGEHNVVIDEDTEQRLMISDIFIHTNYNGSTHVNDIALLKLATNISYDTYSQPIALPKQGHLASGECIISGWGRLSFLGPRPDILQKVNVSIFSDAYCKSIYGNQFYDCMICAGLKSGGVDACSGDSGSPLVCSDEENTYLAGIVSWGYGCGFPSTPGLYVKVSYYTDWINERMSSATTIIASGKQIILLFLLLLLIM